MEHQIPLDPANRANDPQQDAERHDHTPDWQAARTSVERLATLDPEVAVTGHGPAMRGAEMRQALHTLARDFDRIALPAHGRPRKTNRRSNPWEPEPIPFKPKGRAHDACARPSGFKPAVC